MKKISVYFILFVMPALLFLSCAREERVPDGLVRISYYNPEGLPVLVKLMEGLVDEFEKENPDIKVKLEWGGGLQKLLTQIAGGNAPDVFFWWLAPDVLIEKGALMPISEYVEKHKLDLSQYYRCSVDYNIYNGKAYGIPLQLKTLAVVYNKDMFDKENIPYPAEDWTWDDYYRIAKALTKDLDNDGKREQFGCQDPMGGWNCATWVKMNSGELFDYERGKSLLMEDAKTKEALRFVVKLHTETAPSAAETDSMASRRGLAAIHTGKVGMGVIWSWQMRGVFMLKNFRWDVAPIPIPPAGLRRQVFDAGGLYISSATRHPEEAFRFMKFYCGEKGQKVLGELKNGLPCHKEASGIFLSGPPAGMRFFELGVDNNPIRLENKLPEGRAEMWDETMKMFSDEMEMVLIGEKGLDEALKDASGKMEKRYKLF